jgi:hypothetical protein
MSTEQVVSDNNGQSGASAETTETIINEDKVAYSTHKRLLEEKKKQDVELRALREAAEKAKLKDAEASGNTKQLIESLRERSAQMETEVQNQKKKYASEMISMQLREAIAKEGCLVDSEKALKFLGESDYQSLEIDEQFRIRKEDISSVVNNLKKNYDFMFKKTATINDMVPAGTPKVANIPLEKMSSADKKALLIKEFAKQK